MLSTNNYDDFEKYKVFENIFLGMPSNQLKNNIGLPLQKIGSKQIYHDFNNTIAILDVYDNYVLSVIL
ncbi:MAG: hypothetical protein JXR68_02570 [Bacteroidales bacterium]|nr:hypothetical protein [Bacteroidales bacterium]